LAPLNRSRVTPTDSRPHRSWPRELLAGGLEDPAMAAPLACSTNNGPDVADVCMDTIMAAHKATVAAQAARAMVEEGDGEGEVNNEAAAVWQASWRKLVGRSMMEYRCLNDPSGVLHVRESAAPKPASRLCEPVQPRDRPPVPKPGSAPHLSPPEPEKAIPSSPPEPEEPPLAQIQPPQPSLALATIIRLPSSAEQAPPVIAGAPSCSTTRARRPCRRPLSSARRGQARRARRAADPDVLARAAAFASAQVAVMRSTSAGSGKRIYSRQQLLSLRSQGRPSESSSLCAAALCFVPRSARYSCHARAVRLGFADPVPLPAPPCASESVPTVAAREMLVRVHAAAVPHLSSPVL